MTVDAVKLGLENVFADTYALYLKTQNYHWNAQSPHFHDWHVLFQKQYEELAVAIDDLAEQVLIIGFKIPATLDFIKSKTTLKDPNHQLSGLDMVADLYADHQTILKTIQNAIQACRTVDDVGTEDLLIERVRAHSKAAWILRSICQQ